MSGVDKLPISFLESLQTALVCMAIVFAMLIALWILVSVFSVILRRLAKPGNAVQIQGKKEG